MLVQDGAGEAVGPRIHGLAEEARDLPRLAGGGGALHGLLAHHVVPEGGERGEERQVHRRRAARGRVHVLGKGLPVPGDAPLEHLVGNGLDVDEVAHGDLPGGREAGREATPQLPITTLVTPCQDEGVTAPSQQICAS